MFRNRTTGNMGLLKQYIFTVLTVMISGLSAQAKDGLDPAWYSAYRGKQVAEFARMYDGIRYDYANSDPLRGFDCSGFVNFVYGSFNVKVPRISSQFEKIGNTVSLNNIQPGDILLFTGSNASSKVTGHLGIVTEIRQGKIFFVHSATSNNRGIMTSALDETYFKTRFLKAIRVL